MGNQPSSPPPTPLLPLPPPFLGEPSPRNKAGSLVESGFTSKAEIWTIEKLKHQENKLLVLAFLASANEACQGIEPILKEFAARYEDVNFVKMDVDMIEDDAAQRYGIQTTPTFVLKKDGIEVDKLVGADLEELKRKIENHK